jgi:hypothetical protein
MVPLGGNKLVSLRGGEGLSIQPMSLFVPLLEFNLTYVPLLSNTHLLQVRSKVLNDELRETFARWYPGMRTDQKTNLAKEAA